MRNPKSSSSRNGGLLCLRVAVLTAFLALACNSSQGLKSANARGIGTRVQALANAPTLSSPFAFAKVNTVEPTLQAGVSSATSSSIDTQFDWSLDPTFSTVEGSGTVTSNGIASYTLPSLEALVDGTTYYWRARSADAGTASWSAYSSTRSFTVDTSITARTWHQTSTWDFEQGTHNQTYVPTEKKNKPGKRGGEGAPGSAG
jgi:hypothetical protein